MFPFIKMISLCLEIGTASSHEDIHPPRNNNNRPAFCLDCQMNERFADSHKQGRAAPFLVPTQQVPPPLLRGLEITIWKLEFRRDTFDCRDIIEIIKYSEGRGVSRTKRKEFLPPARCSSGQKQGESEGAGRATVNRDSPIQLLHSHSAGNPLLVSYDDRCP